MKKALIAATIAVIAMTGLMASKCVMGDTVNGNQQQTQPEQPATE